jgi:hypothetical protein
MKVLKPQTLAILNDSVPEDDAPLWNAATQYAVGDTVIYQHNIYTALTQSKNTRPATATGNADAAWRFVDATNKYRCIDGKNHTQTVAPEGATELAIDVPFARPANALALLHMTAKSVTLGVRGPGGAFVWGGNNLTLPLKKDSAGWWDYLFGARRYRGDIVIPNNLDRDLIQKAIPPVWGRLCITLHGPPGPAIGTILVGRLHSFGISEYGSSAGLNNKSVDMEDEYGNVTLIKRHTAKTAAINLCLHPDEMDEFMTFQAELAGTMALWSGDDEMSHSSMIVYGRAKIAETTVAGPNEARATVELLGIV